MRNASIRDERGQTLILFSLMISVLLIFVVMVVDVGFFLETRRTTQNVVDAAALAGAQELPASPVNAEAQARDYANRNGFDGTQLNITFGCTSNRAAICNSSLNKFDTIHVVANVTSTPYFGPILSVIGAGGVCWTTGCSTTVEAAGCRGTCGGSGDEVDAVIALDHTGSMKATELQNARDGAVELMKIFDPTIHRIGLSVTPSVHSGNPCDTVETWNDSDEEWLTNPLTADYATSQGVLNASSSLVKEAQCIDLAGNGDVPGPHTDLAEPLRAAFNELQTNGRTSATLGIILETDGAANVYADPVAAAAAGALGPCDYASRVATQAKAAGIQIYTIGYGVNENCTNETAASPWFNKPVSQLLLSMATDSVHFYNQPKTADLDPVFQAIGIQLAAGSKLVK
ncbi:MAG: TadE/TadG family type IV pilus assembly protein [Chloroflexota bacterium]